jgi:MYXO-CTERM domain-containing protein
MRNDHDAGKSTLPIMAILFALASATLVAAHGDASACGGLFCGGPPPNPFAPLPVAQNGENVVFSLTKDPAGGAPTLQAHIQILYTGDAAAFSWVVPVDAAPTLSTGTDRLFTQLAAVTQPRFQATSMLSGTCIAPPTGPGTTGTAGAGGGFIGGTGAAGTSGSAGTSGGVTVSFQGAVGPFDAAVIKSEDPTELKTWLTDNAYVISDAASGLIDVYVRENKHFVALKLLNGVGVRSIQPIVLTFRGTEACVPLRLTAIAANPDMPVLVWVLSDRRVAPRGFYEMKIDEARIDWLRSGANYFGPQGLVSLAANEAGGNAFVTEYAGVSSIARTQVYSNGQFNMTTLTTAMTPPVYVQALINMGLANDPLMLPLLSKYIPMPEALKAMGVTEQQFYANIGGYWQQFAFPPYDLMLLTNEIWKTIVTPRIEAQMMIDSHPYLTRLNTFISPDEMNKDPFFFESRDLTNVPNVHTAVIRTMCGNMDYLQCNAPMRLELPDGRMAWLRAGSKATTCQGATPSVAGLASLPAAEIAWQREETGEGIRVIDNTAAIASGIAANNNKFPNEQRMFPIPTGAGGTTGVGGTVGMGAWGGNGGTGGSGSGVGGVAGGGVGSGGVGPGAGGADAPGTAGSGATGTAGTAGPPQQRSSGGGCGCTTGGPDASTGVAAIAFAGVFGLSLARRRRRRVG